MIADRGDEDLKRRFAALKSRDREGAPTFAELMESSRVSAARRRGASRALRAAAAALILMAGGAVAILLIHKANRTRVVAIADWRSPTDFLLPRPGGALLETLPGITASVIQLPAMDTVRPTSPRSGHTKGDTT